MRHPTTALRRTILLIALAITTTLAGGTLALPAHADTGRRLTPTDSPCPSDLAGYNTLSIADRDRCARAVLTRDLTGQKQNLIDASTDGINSVNGPCPAPNEGLWHEGDKDTARILCNGLQVVNDRLDKQPRAYLLGIDGRTQRLGRAIVAIGNPETAKNIVVSVPGMTARLGAGFKTDIAHADMFAAASAATGNDTASIIWLGHDAPQDPWYDSDGRDAKAAAGPLADFLTGLQKIRRQPAHLTLIAHSYGTAIAGDALTTDALLTRPSSPVDDVIFLGSEGTGTATTAESLHINNKAWACTGGLDRLAGSRLVGPFPDADRFHATQLDCGQDEHTGYWADDDPNKALNDHGTKNMLAIINGTYNTTAEPPDTISGPINPWG
ncbi:alpha/beta hydrolase [Actinomadura oligospora]|uniref:alpha/beta hydrolase n=1 Tax=Actinomadura oligospora TaxID=111804 RepID=UPI00047B0429|nr:alpha/beta hydrolase [Actinomadura oligospora]